MPDDAAWSGWDSGALILLRVAALPAICLLIINISVPVNAGTDKESGPFAFLPLLFLTINRRAFRFTLWQSRIRCNFGSGGRCQCLFCTGQRRTTATRQGQERFQDSSIRVS